MSDAPLLQVIDVDGKTKGKAPALKPEELKTLFRAMLATRLFDQRSLNLQRQGRIGFFVPSSGQEASQVGAGFAMGAEDWIFPSYRTHSIAILKGVSFRRLFDQAWGNATDVVKGRQSGDLDGVVSGGHAAP